MEEEDPDDFASQMMCDPAEGLNMPLKMGDIQHLWVEPDHIPNNLAISIHLDTAFKDPKRAGTGDFFVIEIWGHDRGTGTVYYLDGWRSNTATGAEFINQLVIILQDLRNRRKWPYVVTDERSGGGKEGLFEQFLLDACRSNGIPCPNLIKVSRSTSKEDRILQAIYAWKAGRVRLVRGGLIVCPFFNRIVMMAYLCHFSSVRHSHPQNYPQNPWTTQKPLLIITI